MDKLELLCRSAKAVGHTDPVEPDEVKTAREFADPDSVVHACVKHIDSLQSALQVAQQERDIEAANGRHWAEAYRKWATTDATRIAYLATTERAEKAEAELDEFRRDAEKTKSDTIAVIRKLLEALNHPNPPTSGQWEAIRVEARKQIAAIDSEKEGKK